MNWNAPPLLHLLEERLQTARMELMEDQRVAGASAIQTPESHTFVAELIEKKLAAAASTGFDAVEASLRLDASNCLMDAGLELEEVRDALVNAGKIFTESPAFRRNTLVDVAFSPSILAGIALVLWTLIILLLWLAIRFHPLLLGILLVLGAAPSLGLKRWREGRLTAERQLMASELPARVCRHYVQVFEEGVRDYEAAVNKLLKSAQEEK